MTPQRKLLLLSIFLWTPFRPPTALAVFPSPIPRYVWTIGNCHSTGTGVVFTIPKGTSPPAYFLAFAYHLVRDPSLKPQESPLARLVLPEVRIKNQTGVNFSLSQITASEKKPFAYGRWADLAIVPLTDKPPDGLDSWDAIELTP